MNLQEFDEDKKIDPSQLDVECVRQDELFFKWAQAAVAAKVEYERLKFHVDRVESSQSMACRKDPAAFGLVKDTEAAIKEAVRTSKPYRVAVAKMLTAKAESELCAAAVDAMDQKKRMLELLVTLHGQQYFAGPSTPRNLVRAYNERTQQQQAKHTAAARKRNG